MMGSRRLARAVRLTALSLTVSAGAAAAMGAAPAPVAGQLLEASPNVTGVWTAEPGVIHFHILHRFQVLQPPSRKVLNTPTFLVGAGVGSRAMVGLRYATSSLLLQAEPNEWEVFGRWAPLVERRAGVDGAVRAGWNGTAGSADGEVAVARGLGPVRVHVAGRGFSAWRGEDPAAAVAGGVVWRLHRWVAVAADVAQLLDGDEERAWGAGLQLGIPYTPHTLSLHASNVNATTLQSSTVGIPDRRLWGFEFTVPITLARYFGRRGTGGGEPGRQVRAGAGAAGDPSGDRVQAGGREHAGDRGAARYESLDAVPSDTVVVTMDNRLRFLPDTVRIRAGQAVRWENTSDIIHTVTADPARAADPANVQLPAGARPFDSGDLVPDAVFVHRFERPGTYRYVCLPHELAGMTGVVVVEPAPGG